MSAFTNTVAILTNTVACSHAYPCPYGCSKSFTVTDVRITNPCSDPDCQCQHTHAEPGCDAHSDDDPTADTDY